MVHLKLHSGIWFSVGKDLVISGALFLTVTPSNTASVDKPGHPKNKCTTSTPNRSNLFFSYNSLHQTGSEILSKTFSTFLTVTVNPKGRFLWGCFTLPRYCSKTVALEWWVGCSGPGQACVQCRELQLWCKQWYR